MQKRRRDCLLLVGLLCLIMITLAESGTVRTIPVGVILDLSSSLGSSALNCTNIGLLDFYSSDYSYETKLQLHFRDSKNDLLTAASVAWDLIDNEKVHAILGPQNYEQAGYIVALGKKFDVPVIWFSPTGPSLLPPRSPFSIYSNSSRSHCFQFEAIAAIIRAYNWRSVIPIYEEPDFSIDLIPCLTYALQEMDTLVPKVIAIRRDSNDSQIAGELNKINPERTFVFLAHMSVELWSRLVQHAKDEGMMSKGHAWILTQGLSSVIDPKAKDIKVKGYMDGALGVRPSVAVRQSFSVLNRTIVKRLSLARALKFKYNNTLSLSGLWAYDAITALANAVEEAGLGDSAFGYGNESGVYLEDIGMRNETGQKLRRAIWGTDFFGLSGNFNLRQGQLEPSQVVAYNIVKGIRERIIGYWRPGTGLFQNYSGDGEPAGKYKLRDPTWPGNTKEIPPKLKIGVPKTHFTEFVDVNWSVEGQNVSATGFSAEVFKKVAAVLPFPHEFVPVNNNNGYDDLLCDITNKNVDVIIGDITILASRTNCVDFTMPYLDSSVSMVVKVRSDSKSRWILFKPFDLLLWLILGAILVAATVIVITLEKKAAEKDEGSKYREYISNPLLIYVTDVGFLKNSNSKWVVIVVMFLLGMALQVYTANLTSILTDRIKAKPSPLKDLQEIKRSNKSVAYQNNSWVKGLLTDQIGFNQTRLKALGSRKEYNETLSNEEKENDVVAIFDETPYLLLFLSHCRSCKMTGPIYKTPGFAFAFPKNSTLVSSFSAAILKVTENVTAFGDMMKNISLSITIDKSEYKSGVETRSLTIEDFGGLFPIACSVLALFSLPILKPLWLRRKWISYWTVRGGGVIK